MAPDGPAAEVSTGSAAALNAAAAPSHHPPRKRQRRGDTPVQPRGLRGIHVQCNQVLSSAVGPRYCFLFALQPLLPLSCSFSSLEASSPCPPMPAHLPYISPRDTYATQNTDVFLCLLLRPHTLSPSFSC